MVVEYSFDVFRNLDDYEHLLAHLRSTGWKVHAEPLPKWFLESRRWDTSMTRGSDARQIWAFREPAEPEAVPTAADAALGAAPERAHAVSSALSGLCAARP